ncbi:HAD family hydrolase [Patescibacteria group bacterium]|nr:HAD family hydrolase [Patescibacteria group bacterium]
MKYNIPQIGVIEINTIVLDLNGTLAVRGKIVDGVKERLITLKKLGIKLILFTGDQRGNASDLCNELDIDFKKAVSQKEKEQFFLELDTEHSAAIGNSRIDNGKFRHAKLSIATLQAEGIHTGIIGHVDIIVPTISDALDLFIDSDSLKATMRI